LSTATAKFAPKEEDFLVGEVVINTNHFGLGGYDAELFTLLETTSPTPYDLSAPLGPKEETLPIMTTVYTLPSTPLHASRHLLRFVLPTAQYYAPTIEDPLTEEVYKAPTKPSWILKLEEEDTGARVDIVLRPRVDETDSFLVRVDGEEKVVLNEKESLNVLGRGVLEGENIERLRGHVRR
jgi:hypothetical protein